MGSNLDANLISVTKLLMLQANLSKHSSDSRSACQKMFVRLFQSDFLINIVWATPLYLLKHFFHPTRWRHMKIFISFFISKLNNFQDLGINSIEPYMQN